MAKFKTVVSRDMRNYQFKIKNTLGDQNDKLKKRLQRPHGKAFDESKLY